MNDPHLQFRELSFWSRVALRGNCTQVDSWSGIGPSFAKEALNVMFSSEKKNSPSGGGEGRFRVLFYCEVRKTQLSVCQVTLQHLL